MSRYICIHGHFYQPPRENPWLEYLEGQDSAYPYHDWNERITAECYATNARSRVLNPQGKIAELVNNYSWISFNFGPTLLSWMEHQSPEAYAAILQADRESQQRFSGHGSALAQAYNHMIMPLANARDRATQVKWGIADFKHRFGRDPEGMWLPETAADTASLEALASNGIRFTILAPRQAKRTRAIGSKEWIDASGGRMDPTKPYLCRLPSGRSIVLFFYDGPISQALAFESLLESGYSFAERLKSAFRSDRKHAQLVHIATDGETYGHHRRYAEMALSFAIRLLSGKEGNGDGDLRLTNYGEYLELHPPDWEAEIHENSSWSCAHGVERWRSNCGCNSGMHPNWDQRWRAPLRAALDWLRDRTIEIFDSKARGVLRDPWQAREHYIEVVLDRDNAILTRFFSTHSNGRLTPSQRTQALRLLEMQRNAMLMYTSCGWFFDELSGIETVQVIRYAARALQLAEQVTGEALEEEFLSRMDAAESNLADRPTGRSIYLEQVKPSMVDLTAVAAHYAVSSLFDYYPDDAEVYCYRVVREVNDSQVWGKRHLALGRIRVESTITRESAPFTYGALHLGDHNISGGVRPSRNMDAYQVVKDELTDLFAKDDVPGMIHAVDRMSDTATYSLRCLFSDHQHRIVDKLLEGALEQASALYRSFYREYGPMARFLAGLSIPVPQRFRTAIDLTLQEDLSFALRREPLDVSVISSLMDQVRASGIQLDSVRLEFKLRTYLDSLARRWKEHPNDAETVLRMEQAVAILDVLPFRVHLWTPQNMAYDILHGAAARPVAEKWRKAAARIADKLGVAAD